jgi:hypothetical protein
MSCAGFYYPGCEQWRPRDFEVPTQTVQFGPVTGFGTGMSTDGVGPVYVAPSEVISTAAPNPGLPIQDRSIFDLVWSFPKEFARFVTPESAGPWRAIAGIILPGGLILLLALWAFRKIRR